MRLRPRSPLVFLLLAAVPFDGASAAPLLCSLSSIRLCDESLGCLPVMHEEVNVPRFFTVDLEGKRIAGTRPDGSEASSTIDRTIARLMKVSIQGVENGRAWSATIADDGAMSFVVSADAFGFIGFGACTNP